MRRTSYTCICGRPLSKRDALKIQNDQRNKELLHYTSQGSLIRDKVFSKAQVRRLVAARVLTPMNDRGKKYFLKTEVVKGLNFIKPKELFS